MPTANATRTVREITAIIADWVAEYTAVLNSFHGALLWGGITAVDEDEPFDLRRDVDVVLFLGADDERRPYHYEVMVQGLMVEVGHNTWENVRDSATVLANPYHAANIATGRIVADPHGELAELVANVRRDYAKRGWVEKRVAATKEAARGSVSRLAGGEPDGLFIVTTSLTAILAAASLATTGYRRSLSLLGDITSRHGRDGIYRRCVQFNGFDHLTASDVEEYLRQAARAFDYALTVKRTKSPVDFKLVPHLRPYMVDITRETLLAGDPNGAMLWVVATYVISMGAIMNDAPEPERGRFSDAYDAFKRDLGMDEQTMATRLPLAEELLADVSQLADEIVASHPDIQ